MDYYFQCIIENLSIDDFSILAILYDEGVNMSFKAISNKSIIEKLEMSKNKYFNHLAKLENNQFIQFAEGSRKSKIYLTQFGIMAIQKVIKEEEIEC